MNKRSREIEGTIKNGESRDTGNIGHTRLMTKTNKIRNTNQKTKKMSNSATYVCNGYL